MTLLEICSQKVVILVAGIAALMVELLEGSVGRSSVADGHSWNFVVVASSELLRI